MQCSIVQLQRRPQVDPGTLRWLYLDDAVAIREISRAVHIPGAIHVDGCAAFAVQDLVQSLFRAGLWRWLFPNCEGEVWPSTGDYYETESEPIHVVIILLISG